jgi:hypothetical protein
MRTSILKVFILITIGSCGEKKAVSVQYKDGKQILSMNTITKMGERIDPIVLQAVAPDTVQIGDEFSAKLFLSNSAYNIVDARFDCPLTDLSVADTSRRKIIGCTKGLLVDKDTIRIYFRVGGDYGLKQFDEITALSMDTNNIFRYHTGTFKYFVKP